MSLEEVKKQIASEFPKVRVVESRWTPLGGITLGNRIFVKPGFSKEPWQYQYALLRHERVHLRQQKKMGLGSQWLGLAVFGFLYLFVLPIGLSYFRWRFEREAYLESLQAWGDLKQPLGPRLDYYVSSLSGKQYLWAWPRKWVERYFWQKLQGGSHEEVPKEVVEKRDQ